jgi:hypothetical protein
MASKPKAKQPERYQVLQPFGDFSEGDTLEASALGDELEARIADGFVAPAEDAAAAEPAAPAATTVVGKNGTITATVK